MSRYVELSFDSTEMLPVRLDLQSQTHAAWNHLIIETNYDHRMMYLKSIIQSNLVLKGKKAFIKSVIFKDSVHMRSLMNMVGGRIFYHKELRLNLFKKTSPNFNADFYNQKILKEYEKFSLNYGIEGSWKVHSLIEFKEGPNFHLLNESEKQQTQILLDSTINHNQLNLIKNFLIKGLKIESDSVVDILDLALNNLTLGEKFDYDCLVNAAKILELKKSTIILLDFKQNNKMFDIFFSNNPTDLSGCCTVILDSYDSFVDYYVEYFILQSKDEIDNIKDALKVIHLDKCLKMDSDNIVEALRVARHNGMSLILSEEEFNEITNKEVEKRAILSNCQTVVCGKLGKYAKIFIKDFGLSELVSDQYFQHETGVSYSNLNFEEKIQKIPIRDLRIEESSQIGFKEKGLSYSQALMLTENLNKIKEVKSRFINYIVDNKIGVFNLPSQLMNGDLEHIDKEMKKHKINELILIVPQDEIDESILYEFYGYKKCKNKITVKFINKFNDEMYKFSSELSWTIQKVSFADKTNNGKLFLINPKVIF